MENKTFRKIKKENGITLIALIITIIVLLILASVTVATLTGDHGLITATTEAKFKAKLVEIKEAYSLFILEKQMENSEFSEESLTADKNILSYNTKPEGEQGTIKTILNNIEDSYAEKIEIIKGKMYYVSTNKQEIAWLKDIGIEPNPYDIKEGTLLSSNNNLLLMDSSGTLVIPGSVTKIGAGAFRNLQGLKTIVLPETCVEIGDNAFSGNTTLTNIVMNNGLKKIGNYAFHGCTSLVEVDMPDTVTTVGSECFSRCTSLERVKLSNNLTSIPFRMFEICRKLKSIEIPESVKEIGGVAFNGCNLITKINIPASTRISGSSLSGMQNLQEIKIDKDNEKYKFENGLLLSKDGTILYMGLYGLTTITIPDTVTEIVSGSLESCPKLSSITIPKSVTTINTAFPTSLHQINVEPGNTSYASVNGNLYDSKVETLIKYCTNEANITLPSTLKRIKTNAFIGQSNIKTIDLPNSLEALADGSFSGTSITEITIPEGVKTISCIAFAWIDRNVSVTIQEGNPYYKSVDGIYILSKDGKKLITTSQDLATYNIPDSVETIGRYAFYAKGHLKEIKLPDHIKVIESEAFDYSWYLTKVEIPSSVETIGASAFSRCGSLTEIIIDKEKDSIAGAPWDCPYGDRAVIWKK